MRFDHQLFSWWLAFHHGFLPEPFVASASDEEIERRLALMCRLLGMSSYDYRRFIQHPYVNLFWLRLAKYQASTWAMVLDNAAFRVYTRAGGTRR
jgi:hypothetical protein